MSRKIILWVEDEDEQSSVMVKLFNEIGYKTYVRSSAEDALQLVSDLTPDLLLIDIKLKEMDGLTLFDRIRKIKRLEKVPVVFVTAYHSLKTATEARRKGAADYITKPFDVDYLVDRVRELVPPNE